MFKFEGGVSGRITLEVLSESGKVRDRKTFKNIMTSGGLHSWAAGILGAHIALGSGSRVESESVTGLQGFVRSASGTYTYYDANLIDEENGVMRTTHRLTVVFPVEVSAQNYSELGIHNDNVNALQTYALIRDAGGQPTSVGVLEGERIRAIYDVQYSLPLQEVLTKTIGGASTTVTVIPYRTGQLNAIRLPTVTSGDQRYWESGQNIPQPSVLPSGGVPGVANAAVSQNEWVMSSAAGQLNLPGGISLMKLGGVDQPSVMIHFDPPVNKTSKFDMVVKVISSLKNGAFYA